MSVLEKMFKLKQRRAELVEISSGISMEIVRLKADREESNNKEGFDRHIKRAVFRLHQCNSEISKLNAERSRLAIEMQKEGKKSRAAGIGGTHG